MAGMEGSFILGRSATARRAYHADDVQRYVDMTGDHNPIHVDAAYAAHTMFGRPIVPGPLVLTLITTLFANELPGPGCIYLSHDIRFVRPVFIGDEVVATVTISEVMPKGHLILDTVCANSDGLVVIEGHARVKVLDLRGGPDAGARHRTG